jgi:hypothetical protein
MKFPEVGEDHVLDVCERHRLQQDDDVTGIHHGRERAERHPSDLGGRERIVEGARAEGVGVDRDARLMREIRRVDGGFEIARIRDVPLADRERRDAIGEKQNHPLGVVARRTPRTR